MMASVAPLLLHADGVTVELGGNAVVRDVSLELRQGEFVGLVGPNGAGKTTLMRALAGLVPSSGRIEIGSRPLETMIARKRARTIAYLPQGHVFHWPMNVAAVVALGRHPHADIFSRLAPADRDAISQALKMTGTEDFADRAVTTLSGGERARVALARALATQAPMLFADEPTASLDPRHQLIVMELLRQATRSGNAVLAILHDLTLAARFADRVLVMQEGRIVAEGPPQDALSPAQVARVFTVDAISVDTGAGMVPIARRPL